MLTASQQISLRAAKRTRGGRQRLLQAAANVLQTHGLSGTSLQMIAEELGVSKAAIYHHFRTKDDIVDALMEPVIADTETAVSTLTRLPKAKRVQAARSFYAQFVVRYRMIIGAVFFDRPALRSEVSARVDELVGEVARLLAGGASTPARLAKARALVYGVAAVVAEPEQHSMTDPELLAYVQAIMADESD